MFNNKYFKYKNKYLTLKKLNNNNNNNNMINKYKIIRKINGPNKVIVVLKPVLLIFGILG